MGTEESCLSRRMDITNQPHCVAGPSVVVFKRLATSIYYNESSMLPYVY